MSKYFTGGRQPGAIGRSHAVARNAIVEVFKLKGGVQGLWNWACKSDENESVFYSTLLPKLLPTELAEAGYSGDNRIQVVILPPEHSQSQVAPVAQQDKSIVSTTNYPEQDEAGGLCRQDGGPVREPEA